MQGEEDLFDGGICSGAGASRKCSEPNGFGSCFLKLNSAWFGLGYRAKDYRRITVGEKVNKGAGYCNESQTIYELIASLKENVRPKR